MSEDGDSTDTSEGKDAAGDEDPLRPTLPEQTPANSAETGPGEAAAGREERQEEEEASNMQDEALERASHSTRSEIPAPQALGGQ